MKALIFNKTGEPEDVLEQVEIEKPVPGSNEVLIKVLGSPIHPADILFIEGEYRYKPEFPQIGGLEGAGIVESTGQNVNLKKGKLVAFSSRKAWAEYITVNEADVIVLPNNFPVEKAAQFCLNPFTVWGLLDESNAAEGDWLLLTASNSIVSKIAIQVAKQRGIKTISVVRDLNQSNELLKLGTYAVLDQSEENFSKRINELTNGKGVNIALDSVGGKLGTLVLQSMAPFGKVIIYGLLSNDPVQFYNSQIVFKNLTIKGFGIRGYLQQQTVQQKKEMVQALIEQIGRESFLLPVEQAFALEQFKEALKADSQRNRKGKIIFKFSD